MSMASPDRQGQNNRLRGILLNGAGTLGSIAGIAYGTADLTFSKFFLLGSGLPLSSTFNIFGIQFPSLYYHLAFLRPGGDSPNAFVTPALEVIPGIIVAGLLTLYQIPALRRSFSRKNQQEDMF